MLNPTGMIRQKKAQVTLFIILGIVIIFSTAIIIFIKQQVREEIPAAPVITEKVPTQFEPLKIYIDDCISITAQNAVYLIGAHGGYIGLTPEYQMYTGESFDVDLAGLNPTEKEGLTMAADWQVPYWHYMNSPNDCSGTCTFDSKRPPLLRTEGKGSIEEQIDKYVSENLKGCLGDYGPFIDQGMAIEEKGNLSVKTIIAEREMMIFVEYPLEATLQETKAPITQHLVTVDVDLRKIYTLASEITNMASESKFLERHTLNLIAGFSGIDEKSLPPMAGTDFAFVSKTWVKSSVEAKLKDILAIYVNMLQASGTENFNLNFYPENKIKTGLYNYMVLPLQGTYYDTSVDFNYLGWPIYFYISPGEIIRAREGVAVPIVSLLIPFQRYDLPYDVSYPVLVELSDKSAFNGRGYSFFFALESNIRNNEPVTEDYVQMTQATDVSEQAQLCNDNQRTSGEVTINVVDQKNRPFEGAAVYFSVGDLMCPMGEAMLDNSTGTATFTGKFPMGAIGSIIIMHPEAEPYTIEFFRAKEEPVTLDLVKLNRAVFKNMTAKRLNVNREDGEWNIDPTPQDLAANEQVVVSLEKDKSENQAAFTTTAVVKGKEQAELRLIPGEYKMTVTLMRDNVTIKIPDQTISGQKVQGTTLVNDGVFPTQYVIDVTFDNSIDGDNTLEFYGLYFNLEGVPESSRKFDDISEWNNVTQIAGSNRDLVMPVYR